MSQENIAYSSEISDEIKITPSAEKKLAELLAEADPGIQAIRVYVSGGGCDGMEYGITFAEEPNRFDNTLEGDGYKLFVDSIALSYLEGSEIDFSQQGANASFVFNNVFQAVGGSGGCSGCGGGGF